LRKNHREKLITAAVVKHNTGMHNQWRSERVHLGHVAGRCRNPGGLMRNPVAAAIVTRLESPASKSPWDFLQS